MGFPTARHVWTVIYPDRQNSAGFGVARFDNADEARSFATAHRPCSVHEDIIPADTADRWTFTRWVR